MKTRTIALTLSLLAATASSMGRPAINAHGASLVTPPSIEARLDAALARVVKSEHLNFAVLVRNQGRIMLRGAFRTSRGALSTKTPFSTPQLTTLFTQAAMVRLLEQGKLPKSAVDTARFGYDSGLRNAIRSIERASGMSFASYLQHYLFRPVHMSRTAVVQPAGALPAVRTTVDDLDRWDQAALGCTLAAPAGMVWTTGKPWGWSPMLRGPISIRSNDVRDGIVLTQHILPTMPGEDSAVTVLSARGSTGSQVSATVLKTLR